MSDASVAYWLRPSPQVSETALTCYYAVRDTGIEPVSVTTCPHGIASAHFICPSKPSSVARDFSRAPRATLNGFVPGIQIVAKMRPRSRPVRACPGTDAPDGPPTIDAMPAQIHTQPDPDHFCETCGGPSELISQTITPWDGNKTMAREVSPWTPRCADPWCRSRRPRHRKTRTSAGH